MDKKIIKALQILITPLCDLHFEVTPYESVLVFSDSHMLCGCELCLLIAFCDRRNLSYYVRSVDDSSQFVIYK